MKNLKSAGQCFVALALAFVLSVSFFETAHATGGFGGGDRGDFWSDGGIHTGTILTELSYNALSELCILQNALIEQGVYDDQYPFSDSPYDLSATVRYDSAEGVYVISVSYRGNYYNLRNASGAIYFARYDDGANINTIRLFVTNIFDQVSAFRNRFNEYSTVIAQEFEYLNSVLHLSLGADGWLENQLNVFYYQLELLTGYITGFEDDPSVPSVMSKIDEVVSAIENISIVGGDNSRIVALVSQISTQLQQGGTIVSGEWQPTTIYDYIQGIYEGIGTGGGGGGTISDGSLIYNAIKNFQVDFDDTFSDLKQIYPVEKVEKIGNGSFEWNGGVDILNSVSASDKLSTTTIYRLPQTAMHVMENNGTFRIDNNGFSLPVSFSLFYDNASHNVSTYAVDEVNTVIGTDIVLTDAYPTTPISLKVYGQTQQNGIPSAGNSVPVYGGFESGDPYVYMYKGSADAYKQEVYASFPDTKTPLHGLPVSSGGNYVDENGQEWLCDVVDFSTGTYTQYIKSVTYDGSSDEVWEWASWWTSPGAYTRGIPASDIGDYPDSIISEKFAFIPNCSADGKYGMDIHYWSGGTEYRALYFSGISSLGITDLNSWLSYLRSNPLTIYYASPKPVTYEAVEVFGNGALDSSYTRINTGDSLNLPISITYAAGNPFTALYSDTDGNWYKEREDGTSVEITDSRVDILNAAFNYKEYDNAAGIKFNSGTNIINVSSGDLTVDYVKGSKFFNWLYLYLNNLDGGTVDIDALLDKLTDIEDALSNISGDVDIDNNLDIDIDSDNDSYNVFYVTDPDTGEDTSIVDLSGNALTAFGKLLNFLYQIGFGEALNSFGDTVDGLTDFYTGVGDGGADVWAS